MAYFSMACLAIIMLSMFGGRIDKEMLPLAQTLAWVFSANIFYYYGGNAVEALKGKR